MNQDVLKSKEKFKDLSKKFAAIESLEDAKKLLNETIDMTLNEGFNSPYSKIVINSIKTKIQLLKLIRKQENLIKKGVFKDVIK